MKKPHAKKRFELNDAHNCAIVVSKMMCSESERGKYTTEVRHALQKYKRTRTHTHINIMWILYAYIIKFIFCFASL